MTYNLNTHQFENGRRFHGYRGGAYMYPNDEKEQDRLDIFHKMFLVARQEELHRAPITRNDSPPRILDLGTGTGIWAIDMADKYPDAEVERILLISSRNNYLAKLMLRRIPRNLRFQISDFESEWTLGKDSFDLIHLRAGCGSVSSWPTLFRRAFEHLKPGYGWIEYVDIDIQARTDDGTLTTGHALYQWQQYLLETTERAGKPLRYEARTGQLLREAGFVDVQEVVLKLPLSPWPSDSYLKDCGRWYNLGLSEALEGYTLAPMTRVGGWSVDDVKNLLGPVQKDINNRRIHAYSDMHIWIARRPDWGVEDRKISSIKRIVTK
ncbi:S-adenosyl-L-methionine-dependent methyltransferase [Tuber borchii]|uniref:S-adenosyl-L-methionine-dependent methyltransferase n=1 Tax=Tuber borchii TaxID=42251 RepID=A0A2T6ZSS8_TUBBO|nr:S-adenosyl-L-methionine-dependent methyltransferase [Tuber borchii]